MAEAKSQKQILFGDDNWNGKGKNKNKMRGSLHFAALRSG
jgi:hypothetical protein